MKGLYWFNHKEFCNPFSMGKCLAISAILACCVTNQYETATFYFVGFGLILDLVQWRDVPAEKFIENRICPVCGDGNIERNASTEKFYYKQYAIDVSNYVRLICDVCHNGIPSQETFDRTKKILDEFREDVDNKEKQTECNNKDLEN